VPPFPALEASSAPRQYYRPLTDAAENYVQWAASPEDRVYLGLTEFDEAMRGTAPGEITMFVGFSHSGKTLLVTEAIRRNRNRTVALFTPDETQELVLCKLVAAETGIGAVDLEKMIQRDEAQGRKLLLDTAASFPNFAVFDGVDSIERMDRAMDEAEQVLGRKFDLVVFDYLELLEGFEMVKQAAAALKQFFKRREVAGWVLHQSSRHAGADGAKVTLTSGAYGGEQPATHIIGVRRRKYDLLAQIEDVKEKIANARNSSRGADPVVLEDRLRELEHDLAIHEHTVTVNLPKNKRPPSTLVDDVDFNLDLTTGRLSPLGRGELPKVMQRPAAMRALEF
jgi:KaiC/GvpD/RAD55 family RecA-like ATPase